MKVPLRYQITEFDCGSVSLINCISYLFDRQDIPPELLRAITTYTLDCYDEYGNLGQGGTSREAIRLISKWITDFSNRKDFGIRCEYLQGESVTLDRIRKWTNKGGCVNFRCWHIDNEHYVMITKVDKDFVYLFDPYYLAKDHYEKNKDVDIILDEPFIANRKVAIDYFDSEVKKDFTLGPVSKREALLIRKEQK